MNKSSFRILVLEDDPEDYLLVQKALKAANDRLELFHVDTLQKALESLGEGRYDLILSDLSLPDSQGLETVEQLLEKISTIPLIVLTGLKDDEVGLKAIRIGAQDFLNKEELNPDVLKRVIRYAFERKKILIELQSTKQDLEKSNLDLEQFASVASHDLQEPLRMVGSFTQLLEKRYGDQLDETAQEYIRYAVDGSKRMKKLIEDLLKFSRVGRKVDRSTDVDLNKLLEEIKEDYQFKIEETHTQINSENLPVIRADKSQMKHLFQNFISNAIKFRRENPVITITAKDNDTEWEFSVKDNGIGIEQNYLDKIFVIFQRLHKQEEYLGTGIGLAVCKKVVENYGGTITVDSQIGEGTTFTFTLKKGT